jgi:nucleotide-binding universal stress UspA family protein
MCVPPPPASRGARWPWRSSWGRPTRRCWSTWGSPSSPPARAAGRYLGPETSDRESREDRSLLEAIAEEFRAGGVAVEARLGFGDPAPELARLAEAAGADLLITGSHGHRLLQDLIHGATASGLRHRVRCPVLTVPRLPHDPR